MGGCLRRLGCLTVLVVAVLLYFQRDEISRLYSTRDSWLPRVRERIGMGGGPAAADSTPAANSADGRWAAVTPDAATRGRQRVRSLSGRQGPAYANVTPEELTAYIYDELRRQLPPSAEQVEAAVFGDQLHVRAVVKTSDLGGTDVLGPVAQFLGEREPIQFGGTLEVVRPGLAQFRIRQIKLRQLSIPGPLIPQIVSRLNRGVRLEGVAADALPLAIPGYIGDVRIARGQVTLYKTVQ